MAAVTSLPRRCATYLEFSDTRHFAAWAVLCGVLAAFSLFHLKFVDFSGVFCRDGGLVPGEGALPGECFYFLRATPTKLGIVAHLVLILPASVLVLVQFVPRIRHKAARVHRISGRISLVLALTGAAGALPTVRHAFGGDPAAQAVGYLAIFVFMGTQLAAYWHIKHRRIEQHRAWMMRSWAYGSGIITLRVFMIIGAIFVSIDKGYYMAQPCDKIDFMLRGKEETLQRYPECEAYYSGANPRQHVAVHANISSENIVELSTAFNATYSMGGWLAFTLHAIIVEIYLRSTGTKAKKV